MVDIDDEVAARFYDEMARSFRRINGLPDDAHLTIIRCPALNGSRVETYVADQNMAFIDGDTLNFEAVRGRPSWRHPIARIRWNYLTRRLPEIQWGDE